MGRLQLSPLTLLLLLLARVGRGEGPTWGAEEDDNEDAVHQDLPAQAVSNKGDDGACPPCDPGSCESPVGCLAGVVRDRCGCCQVEGNSADC